uniref:CNNM transmembrane domain-containing protein n=1 Tax=Araucaria cunninghamii TaxID=56994 RepID=A0A0D6R789_ARACU
MEQMALAFTIVQLDDSSVEFGSLWFWLYVGISAFLVIFGGIMSGLTLGLMSLGSVDLEVLQRSGSPSEKKQAATILPVVRKQHQLLVTLLLCNAAAMEALPIYLDKIFSTVVSVILSVTFVLAFGEVIPQATCAQYGLAIGANCVWLVRILMVICYPIAYPVGKVLDCVIGHNQSALFRRAQLKVFVSIHGQEAGKGGELTHDETTIISGALDLTEKTAEEAMTPIESAFSLDVNVKLDWETVGNILARGHSRVPVYSGSSKNIIGLLLVKSLLIVRPETETLLSDISIRKIPRVPADMPLYDILNEFQKGGSHMAAVVKAKQKEKPLYGSEGELSHETEQAGFKADVMDSSIEIVHADLENRTNVKSDLQSKSQDKISTLTNHEELNNTEVGVSERMEDREVIGIITLEDVFEELLQEEIVDETDEYVDVHKRIRVAVAVAASTIARAPSRRLISHRTGGGHG